MYLKSKKTEHNRTHVVQSLYIALNIQFNLAEIICNNSLPLCNRETLVYDLRNVPGTFAQIEVPNSFKGVNVIDIHTKWLGNFRRFELSRVNLSHEIQNWFVLSGVSRKRGFENSGVKL